MLPFLIVNSHTRGNIESVLEAVEDEAVDFFLQHDRCLAKLLHQRTCVVRHGLLGPRRLQ